MACSKCFKKISEEISLKVQCDGCGDCFHGTCLSPEDVSAHLEALKNQTKWYCKECANDSDSIREELKSVWGDGPHSSQQRPEAPKTPTMEMEEDPEVDAFLDRLLESVEELDRQEEEERNKEEEEKAEHGEEQMEQEPDLDIGKIKDFTDMLNLFE